MADPSVDTASNGPPISATPKVAGVFVPAIMVRLTVS